MNYENTALKLPNPRNVTSGIHLVYSRNQRNERAPRQIQSTRRPAMMPQRIALQQARPIRESQRAGTLGLAAAALAAPLVWIGHALLQWLRVR